MTLRARKCFYLALLGSCPPAQHVHDKRSMSMYSSAKHGLTYRSIVFLAGYYQYFCLHVSFSSLFLEEIGFFNRGQIALTSAIMTLLRISICLDF